MGGLPYSLQGSRLLKGLQVLGRARTEGDLYRCGGGGVSGKLYWI